MSELRWEWNGANGARVAATLDGDGEGGHSGAESVFVDGVRVSRVARGTKPEGHAVPGQGVVTFDRERPICVFRDEEGIEVLPVKWPSGKRGRASSADGRSSPARSPEGAPRLGLVTAGAVLAALLAVGATLAFGSRVLAPRPDARGALSYRAQNGLFVTHHPASFTARPAVLPPTMSGLVLEDGETGDVIVVTAAPAASDEPRDTWAAQRRMHPEALASVPRADGAFEERARRDERCHGEAGAVVVGGLKNRRGEPATLWSCTFVRGAASYAALYVTRDPALPEVEARLRGVIDATELTQLGELSGASR